MRGFKDASDLEIGEKLESDRLPDEIGEEAEAEKLPDEVKEFDEGSQYFHCPVSHGKWEGKRGDSKWIPDKNYIPPEKSKNPNKPYSNPGNLTNGELMAKYKIDGVIFKNGYPNFSEISKGNVQIENFKIGKSKAKEHNFMSADLKLAEEKGCSPYEVEKWRKENNYTWHECEDKRTLQKVPNEIHANVSHMGGRAQN